MGRYTKRLKVTSPNGEPVYAVITQGLDTAHIEVRPLPVVQKDNPVFAQNGLIRFNVDKKKFKEAINGLTNYIESLFLKEMGEGETDESIYSSLGIDRKPRGTKDASKRGAIGKSQGKRDIASLHDSARGNEPTESVRRGNDNDAVAPVGDSSIDGEGEGGG